MSICCVRSYRSESRVRLCASFWCVPFLPQERSSPAPTAMAQSSAQAPQGSTHPSSPIDKDHCPALPANRSAPAGRRGAAPHRERTTTSEGLDESVCVCVCVSVFVREGVLVVVVVEIKFKKRRNLVISEHQHPLRTDRLLQRYVGL